MKNFTRSEMPAGQDKKNPDKADYLFALSGNSGVLVKPVKLVKFRDGRKGLDLEGSAAHQGAVYVLHGHELGRVLALH